MNRSGRLGQGMYGVMISLLALAISTASGTQFFVAPTGSDSNPGTFSLPFLTIPMGV